MNAVLLKSERQDWRTPEWFLELVRAVSPIALDPASNDDCSTGALHNAVLRSDGYGNGLHWDWTSYCDRGLVYCNPEYGRGLKGWAAKFAEEGRRGCELITLTPARPDARWFKSMLTADVLCFWKGRIKFVGAPHAAPFPSMVAYWGKNVGRFFEVFSPHANWIVEP